MRRVFFNLILSLAVLFTTAAMADDWVAVKLRGNVLAEQNGQWVHLARGDVVSDSRTIRTMADGAAQFVRDGETIDLFGSTQMQIHDRLGQRFTTVDELTGKVAIEANVENVKHFAVDTPFLVAVVKGTKFTVTSGTTASQVDVTRGKVGVEDVTHHTFVDVLVGQHASAGVGQSLTVEGSGTLRPITDAKGKVISVVTAAGEVADTTGTSSSDQSPDSNGKDTSGDGSKSDNGKGNGGVPGNGGDQTSGNSDSNGSDSSSGKSDNGKGNGGVPGNGNGKTSSLTSVPR